MTPVVSMLGQGPITSESLAEDTKKVLEEFVVNYSICYTVKILGA